MSRRPQENLIYILAGNAREAADWAHLNCLSKEQYVYLSSPVMTFGLHYFRYVKVGTYRESEDMSHRLLASGAIEVTFPYQPGRSFLNFWQG